MAAAGHMEGFIPFEAQDTGHYQMPRLQVQPPAAPPVETQQQQPPVETQQPPAEDHQGQLNPWDIPVTNDPGEQQQQQAQQQQQPPQQQGEPQTIDQMIDSLALDEGFDVNAIAAEMQVSPESLAKLHAGIKAGLQKTFAQSMQLMKRAVDTMSENTKREIAQRTQNDLRADTALTLLEAKLPFVKDPKMSPVGKAVLGGFMKQNTSIETAVDNTVKYFQQMNNQLGTQFQQHQANARPGGMQGGFSGPQVTPAQPDQQDIDWFKFLGG